MGSLLTMIRHVLLAMGGETPEVITETLFGLWHDLDIKPDGKTSQGTIHILTTSKGGKKLLSESHRLDDSDNRRGAVWQFNQAYGNPNEPLTWKLLEENDNNQVSKGIEILQNECGRGLEDLLSTSDHESAFQQIATRVQEYTSQENIQLHASIAGGRRSLGVMLAHYMSLYGRKDDTLSHVIADLDFNKAFPTRTDTQLNDDEKNKIHFIPFCFPRLKLLLSPGAEKLSPDDANDILRLQQGNPIHDVDIREDFQIKLVCENQAEGNRIEVWKKKTNKLIKATDVTAVQAALYLFLFRYANKARKDQPLIKIGQVRIGTQTVSTYFPDARWWNIDRNPSESFELQGTKNKSPEGRDDSLSLGPLLHQCLVDCNAQPLEKEIKEINEDGQEYTVNTEMPYSFSALFYGDPTHWEDIWKAADATDYRIALERKSELSPQLTKLGNSLDKLFPDAKNSWLGIRKSARIYGVNIPPEMFEFDGKSGQEPACSDNDETGRPIKNVLLLVGGETPAVLWETLAGLEKNNIINGEIHILTTKTGGKKFSTAERHVSTFNERFNTDWSWPKNAIAIFNKDRRALKDILTINNSEVAAEFIFSTVNTWMKKKAENNNIDLRIHASIAGGRKMLGVYLAQAMNWLGSYNDTLSHVVVKPEIERDDDGKARPDYMVTPDDIKNGKVFFSFLPITRLPKINKFVQVGLESKKIGYNGVARLSELFFRDISSENLKYVLDLKKCELRYAEESKYPIVSFSNRGPSVPLAFFLLLIKHANTSDETGGVDITKDGGWRKNLSNILKELDVPENKFQHLLSHDRWEIEEIKKFRSSCTDKLNNKVKHLPERLKCEVLKKTINDVSSTYHVNIPDLDIIS